MTISKPKHGKGTGRLVVNEVAQFASHLIGGRIKAFSTEAARSLLLRGRRGCRL